MLLVVVPRKWQKFGKPMANQSKLVSISKKIAAVGVVIAFLGTLGYNIDYRFALASDVEAQQQKNDRKHVANEIRQLRAEWRYITDKITYYTKEKNTAMVAELKKRLREIEMDIAALEKGN